MQLNDCLSNNKHAYIFNEEMDLLATYTTYTIYICTSSSISQQKNISYYLFIAFVCLTLTQIHSEHNARICEGRQHWMKDKPGIE